MEPMRIYMRAMGAKSLLKREDEVYLAKQIEEGTLEVNHILKQIPMTGRELLRAHRLVNCGALRADRIVDLKVLPEVPRSETEQEPGSKIKQQLEVYFAPLHEAWARFEATFKKQDSEVDALAQRAAAVEEIRAFLDHVQFHSKLKETIIEATRLKVKKNPEASARGSRSIAQHPLHA